MSIIFFARWKYEKYPVIIKANVQERPRTYKVDKDYELVLGDGYLGKVVHKDSLYWATFYTEEQARLWLILEADAMIKRLEDRIQIIQDAKEEVYGHQETVG